MIDKSDIKQWLESKDDKYFSKDDQHIISTLINECFNDLQPQWVSVENELRDIASMYLLELQHALQLAKIDQTVAPALPSNAPVMLDIRVQDLQVRVDSLTHKLKNIDRISLPK